MILSISDYLRKIALAPAPAGPAGPAPTLDTEPAELFKQVRPLLQKMGLQTMVDRSKTTLMPGQIQGPNSLYNLILRRNAQLTKTEIERIKRNIDYLNVIQWDPKAITVQLWWPYTPPEQTGAPAIPPAPAPGVPAAPPK